MRMSGRGLVIVSVVVGVAVVGIYLLLGGGRVGPQTVADPCAPRAWRAPEGSRQVAEQVALSSLDGAACEMGVSREELALALGASDGDLDRFLASRGIDQGRFEEILRVGLRRAVEDAERADAINGFEAFLLRRAVDGLPVDRVVQAYREGRLDSLMGMIASTSPPAAGGARQQPFGVLTA